MKTREYSNLLIKAYVATLLAGILAGLKWGEIGVFYIDGSLLGELFWPLAGMFSGLTFLGAGALPILFILGISNGAAITNYLHVGGSLLLTEAFVAPTTANSIVGICLLSVRSLSFLYGAVGGLYLCIYYLDMHNNGFVGDEIPRKNSTRKIVESIIISAVAFGLNSITF
jgi:hypothetical protein